MNQSASPLAISEHLSACSSPWGARPRVPDDSRRARGRQPPAGSASPLPRFLPHRPRAKGRRPRPGPCPLGEPVSRPVPDCEEGWGTGKERRSPGSPEAFLSSPTRSLFAAPRHNLPRRKKVAQGQKRGRAAHRSLRSGFFLRILPGPVSGSAAGKGCRRLEGAARPGFLPQRWRRHLQVATCSAHRAPVTARASLPALASPPRPLVGCAPLLGGPGARLRPGPRSSEASSRSGSPCRPAWAL